MAETLSVISIVAFIMSGIFGVFSVVLWFLFRIPQVISDLSGRTSRKTLERMRKENERTGNQNPLFDRKNIKSPVMSPAGAGGKSEYHSGDTVQMEGLAVTAEVNNVTEANAETESKTENWDQEPPKTEILSEMQEAVQRKAPEVSITLIEEIMFVHTDELI